MNSSQSAKRPQIIVTLFTRLFPLLFLLIGAAIAIFGAISLIDAYKSSSWPPAEGKILNASVEYHDSATEHGGIYQAEIHYQYSVADTLYSNNRVAFGDYGTGNPGHAQQIVNRYPAGTAVDVYYMPEDPQNSLLEPGLSGQAFIIPAVGAIFFALGVLMLIYLPTIIQKKRSK